MFIRAIKKNGKNYYYIAQTTRKGNKVIQKSILYLGTAESIYDLFLKSKKN